jgi:predicted RNA-binding Zn-ribbon protein involved in translation (DUF1610 family)
VKRHQGRNVGDDDEVDSTRIKDGLLFFGCMTCQPRIGPALFSRAAGSLTMPHFRSRVESRTTQGELMTDRATHHCPYCGHAMIPREWQPSADGRDHEDERDAIADRLRTVPLSFERVRTLNLLLAQWEQNPTIT